jgi:RNA polymerase sigma-70 factor (ECF subfamily)
MPTAAELMKEAFRYQSALTAYAYGMLRDWSLAQDAVQDAFIVLMQKYADHDPESALFPLMKRIVQLKTLELLRTRRKELVVADEELLRLVGDTLADAVTEEEAIQHNQRLSALHACMAQLSESLRTLLVGFYWQRQSCEDLAKVLGRGAPSLRVTLMRVRAKLQHCMSRRLGTAEVLP